MATPATINPTGLSNAMATTNWGGNPKTGMPVYPVGGAGSYNFGNATNPNPPGTSTGTPVQYPGTTGTGVGVPTGGSTGFQSGMPFNSGQNTDPQGLQSKLSDTFGSGMGNFVSQFLTSGGGYNSAITQQNIQAQLADMQHNIDKGYGTLNTELGQQGVSPLSSVAALEKGDYMSEAINRENALVAQDYFQMWSQSMGNEVSVLEAAMGATHEHQGNAGDWAKQFAEFGQGIGAMVGGAGYSSKGGGGFTL